MPDARLVSDTQFLIQGQFLILQWPIHNLEKRSATNWNLRLLPDSPQVEGCILSLIVEIVVECICVIPVRSGQCIPRQLSLCNLEGMMRLYAVGHLTLQNQSGSCVPVRSSRD